MGMIINPYAYVATVDADANAFIAAAGITDAGQQSAIRTLVPALKSAGIWAKCLAIYPFVGGSAGAHSVNMKSPGTYDITWSGTITHSPDGAASDGATGYGDTGIEANADIGVPYGVDDHHLSVYSRTDTGGGFHGYDIGSWTSITFTSLDSAGFTSSDANYYAALPPASPTSTAAMYIGSRTSSTVAICYRNSAAGTDGPSVVNSFGMAGFNFYLMALNSGGSASYFSTHQLAFASIGRGLTPTECGDLYTAVQAYQTALGRQV